MPTYCYRCKVCGTTQTNHAREWAVLDKCCDAPLVIRDYKAEAVAVGPAVGAIRRGLVLDEKSDAAVRDILPTGDDFLKKHKGNRKKAQAEAKAWNDRHEPANPAGNKYRPKVD